MPLVSLKKKEIAFLRTILPQTIEAAAETIHQMAETALVEDLQELTSDINIAKALLLKMESAKDYVKKEEANA